MKTRTATLTLALTAAIGMAGVTHAAGNPFALNALSQGYQVAAADKAQDGKCGATKNTNATDAKAADAKTAEPKAKDGKCGEGKCGASKKK